MIPIEWLERLRDLAKDYGFINHYNVLDLIIRLWRSKDSQEG